MSMMPPGSDDKTDPPDVTSAAWNAVAVASLSYQQEIGALTHVLACAQGHGLTVPDLCRASGLDEAFVRRLLGEAA